VSESILSITSKLSHAAELIIDIDPRQLPTEELAMLKDRLPAWALTVSAIDSSITGLEKKLDRNP
jgi:DNA transposition AAA+ family ATPase